jgi:hypothetical protein
MIFNGIVFGTCIFGGLFILLGILVRFSFTAEHRKIIRLINAIKISGIREETPDAFGMLMQFTGILWLLFGTIYGIILRGFAITGILNDSLSILVLFGPLTLFAGVLKLLKKYYWKNQK